MIEVVIPTLDPARGQETGLRGLLAAGCDARLIVVHDRKGHGFTATVNRGLAQCTGDVCILNDDIEWFQYGWLDLLRRGLHAETFYGVAAPGGRSHTGPMSRGVPGMQGLQIVDHVPFWCALVKRAALERVGHLDPAFIHYGSDNWWCSELHQNGMECVYVRAVYLGHTSHGSGLILAWKEHDDAEMARRRGRIIRSKR